MPGVAKLMRYYEASSTIASSPETVWAVLADGAAWPSFDRFAGGLKRLVEAGH